MTNIHPTAVVHPKAEIGSQCEIGPYSIIGANVKLGEGCRLHSQLLSTDCNHRRAERILSIRLHSG